VSFLHPFKIDRPKLKPKLKRKEYLFTIILFRLLQIK
jgi:hypothetical protein